MLGRTSTMVEAHAEKERVRGVNLDGGRTGGMDLDGVRTVEMRAEEERGARVAWTSIAGTRWRCM
jgi:hypothetical protein